MKYIKLFENFQLDDNFYQWFKGSKIVDDKGEPLVVYHGTPSKFDNFDRYYSGKNWGNTFGRGIYFTISKDYAKKFSKDSRETDWVDEPDTINIIEAYLSIKNPLIVNSVNQYRDIIAREKNRLTYKNGRYNRYEEDKILSKSDNEILMDIGYDGIIYSFNDKILEIICFSNDQIKIIK